MLPASESPSPCHWSTSPSDSSSISSSSGGGGTGEENIDLAFEPKSSLLCEGPNWELPNNDDRGGGPAGVKEGANEEGGRAGVEDGGSAGVVEMFEPKV